MDCVFCKIVNGEIPSYTIYEDDLVKVILNIHPDSNGHLLVIPKEHTTNLLTINNEVLLHVMEISRKMGNLLTDKMGIDGFTLVQNNGSIQEIKHFHFHIKPYYIKKQKLLPLEEICNKLKKD